MEGLEDGVLTEPFFSDNGSQQFLEAGLLTPELAKAATGQGRGSGFATQGVAGKGGLILRPSVGVGLPALVWAQDIDLLLMAEPEHKAVKVRTGAKFVNGDRVKDSRAESAPHQLLTIRVVGKRNIRIFGTSCSFRHTGSRHGGCRGKCLGDAWDRAL